MGCDYKLGQRVRVMDDILGFPYEATIIFIEFDSEMSFNWLYLMSDDEEENTLIDPRFPMKYFKIIPDNEEFLINE